MQIISAIKHSNLEQVQECLARGVDVNCPDPWDAEKAPQDRAGEWSPLMTALELNPSHAKKAIIALLLDSGGCLKTLSLAFTEWTPLSILCSFGDAACVELLLNWDKSRQLPKSDPYALKSAVSSGDLATVECLLNAGFSFPTDLGEARKLVSTGSFNPGMVELLIGRGLPLSSLTLAYPQDSGCGLLDGLIRNGDHAGVQRLRALGVDPNDTTWDDLSRKLFMGSVQDFAVGLQQHLDCSTDDRLALLAVERDEKVKLEILLQRRGGLTATDPFAVELLHQAAKSNATACLQYMLELGVPVDVRCRYLQSTALMDACEFLRMDAVLKILGAGADVNQANTHGDTALLRLWSSFVGSATESTALQITQTLHRAGADLHHFNSVGEGILEKIVASGAHESLRWLVAQGICPNENRFDSNALYQAVCADDLVTMELLMAGGADPNLLLSDATETVLFHARSRESVQLLLKHGVDVTVEDDLFGKTAYQSIRDPMILEAFPNHLHSHPIAYAG